VVVKTTKTSTSAAVHRVDPDRWWDEFGALLLTVVDPADDSVIQDADRYRRFGRQGDGFVGRVTVVRHAFPRVSSAW